MKKKIDCTIKIEIERDRLQISLVILSKSKFDAIKLRRYQLDAIKLLHILNYLNYTVFFYKNQSFSAKVECSYAHLSPNLYLVCCFSIGSQVLVSFSFNLSCPNPGHVEKKLC